MAISRSQMERQLRNMGGIMSLEDPRQGYFLGKLVRKASKAVKKVVKSPVGKAAILGALTFGIPGTQFGGLAGGKGLAGLKGKLFGTGALGDFGATGSKGLLRSLGLTKGGYGSFGGLTGLGKIAGITGLSGLAGLMAKGAADEEDEIDISKLDRGEGLNILDIVARARKNDPEFRFLPPVDFQNLAEGGGVGSLAMNEENVKQKFVSDEAGAIPKKGGGVTPDDMGKLKQSDFDSEEDYKRYLRQLNRKASGGSPVTDDDLEKVVRDFNKQAELTGQPLMTLKELKQILGDDLKKSRKYKIGKAEGGEVDKKTTMIKDMLVRGADDDLIKTMTGASQKEIDSLKNNQAEGKAEGGIMNLGGMEMDLRGGGFVPLGAKEKADDVPARLSKNEFVMTADAVRAAGGGSVDKGADKMYNLMKDLESRV